MELHVRDDAGEVIGKENLVSTVGKALFNGTEILCPVSTSSAVAIREQPELRAYKLGKQKCSYNQVELIIKDICSNESELQVSEAIETTIGHDVDDLLKESCLKFNVRFVNTERMHLYIYVVYANPYCIVPGGESKQAKRYYWVPVTRSRCRKGCKGPVIRGLQRFGRMSRRVSNVNSYQAFADHESIHGQENVSALPSNSNNTNNNIPAGDSWKEPRHLYIAIDEASTHVCPRPQTSRFRLLVAAYDEQHHLLGSAVSSCIRVLANNDAPLGAAAFKLHCHIKGTEKSINCSPILAWPSSGLINDKRQCGRVPLQEMTQTTLNPLMEAAKSVDNLEPTSNAQVLWCIDQDLHFHENEQPGIGDSLSSSCSDETSIKNKSNSLRELCQRVFDACSCKQQGVITLRKFATILGTSRNLLLDIFSVLAIIQVVQEQGKEKYIWLGSDRVKGALQEILETEDLTKTKDPEIQCGTECGNPSIAELGKRFCLLFLTNKDESVKWEFVVDTILRTTRESDIEIMKTTLWKISVILSALHLIVSKRGPTFEWSGSEGVAAHLKSSAHTWPSQRREDPKHQRPYKYRKIDSDDMERDYFETGKYRYANSCQHAHIHTSPCGNQLRLSSPQLPPYACDSDKEETTRASQQMHEVNGSSIYTEQVHNLEEHHHRGEYNLCPSSIGQDCMACSQNSYRRISCDEESEHKNNKRTSAALDQALDQGSAYYSRDEAASKDKCYCLPSLDEHIPPLRWQQSMAAGYIGLKGFNSRQGHEEQSSDSELAFLSCSNSSQDDCHLIANDHLVHHVEDNTNWHFDPLAYLITLYTPQQLVVLQQRNPGFLINFVRYFRQLYHKYGSKSNALVHLPSAIRPCYSSLMFKNLAAN